MANKKGMNVLKEMKEREVNRASFENTSCPIRCWTKTICVRGGPAQRSRPECERTPPNDKQSAISHLHKQQFLRLSWKIGRFFFNPSILDKEIKQMVHSSPMFLQKHSMGTKLKPKNMKKKDMSAKSIRVVVSQLAREVSKYKLSEWLCKNSTMGHAT